MIKINHKRRLSHSHILLSIIFLFVFSFGCGSQNADKLGSYFGIVDLSVTYLSVGTSDCVIIKLPNDKVMMIDSASESQFNKDKVINFLEELAVTSVDYLFLTHPDANHYGNTRAILDSYSIKNIYTPKVDENTFTEFYSTLEVAKERGSSVQKISFGQNIILGGVNLYCLYENSSRILHDYDVDDVDISTEKIADNLSMIMLLEYKGCRFLFSGDTSAENEQVVLDNYKNKIYDKVYEKDIKLFDIDYYMMSSHGSNFGNSKDFLEFIKPKNAIISVGGDAGYLTPSYPTIERLTILGSNILRTDVNGNITVCVNQNGITNLTTEN